MRQLLLAVVVLCSSAALAHAQQTSPGEYPKLEIFGGYSANGVFNKADATLQNENLASLFSDFAGGPKGFQGSIAHNFNRYLGIKADFSMYFANASELNTFNVCQPGGSCTLTTQETNLDRRAFYFMAGPEIKARNRTRVTPFAHGLVGVARSTADFSTASAIFTRNDSHTRTGFAYALGGGLDFRITQRFGVRAMADYVQTFLGDPDPNKSRQNHVRLSLGILFSKP
ncbi:MAG: outer membrane beta-barrel protein [Acidobacteriota bacterium]